MKNTERCFDNFVIENAENNDWNCAGGEEGVENLIDDAGLDTSFLVVPEHWRKKVANLEYLGSIENNSSYDDRDDVVGDAPPVSSFH